MALKPSFSFRTKPSRLILLVTPASIAWVTLLLLFGLGLVLRLNHLTDPPLDFHPARQLRSALLARGMYYQMNLAADPQVRQQAIDLSAGLEAYEPPLFERLVALTYLVTGGEHVWIARLYASLAWLLGGWFLFDLVRRIFGPGRDSAAGGVAALAFYLVLPFGVVASRAFQPDPLMVAAVLATAWAILRWLSGAGSIPAPTGTWKWAVAAGLVGGLAVLIKAMAALPVAAMAVGGVLASGLLWQKTGALPKITRLAQIGAAAAGMILLPALYYLGFFPGDAGGFMSFWTVRLSSLLLSSKFYLQWLALVRGLIDPGVVFMAFLSLFLLRGVGRGLGFGLWIGYFLLGLIFPFQIYTHEYYSLLLVPAVALGLGALAAVTWEHILPPAAGGSETQGEVHHRPYRQWAWLAAFLLAALAILGYYAWVARSVVVAADKRNEPIPWQKMGQELPRQGQIIALTHDYGGRLKYYGWRSVDRLWPEEADLLLAQAAGSQPQADFEASFADQTEGMDYFLVTLFSSLEAQPQLKEKLAHYPIAAQGDGYILYDLRNR